MTEGERRSRVHGEFSGGNRKLIEAIDVAVGAGSIVETTTRIATVLQQVVGREEIRLPDSLTRARAESYARRLLHRCPQTGYTVVVMTWGPGQQTELHDHAGMWCVECVVGGELEIIQYDLVERKGDRCRFDRKEVVRARVGDAGCLIPPFEYHVLRNALEDRPSVTLHVYSGEMDRCHLYRPGDGQWWTRSSQALVYQD
jgi:predicted metal-dependent enzyme (double-stranded beta helix superfamily)